MPPQQFGELIGGDRLAEVVSLHLVAAVVAQEDLLFLRLDSFGDNRETQSLAHGDDRLGDGLVFRVVWNIANERAVHLEGMNWKRLSCASEE